MQSTYGDFLKEKKDKLGEFVKEKKENLGKILKQTQDNIITLQNNIKFNQSRHSMLEHFMVTHASLTTLIIVSIVFWLISLSILISNTSKMLKDNNAKKYYNLNTVATVLVTLAIILLVIFYTNSGNSDVQTYFYEIFSSIYSMLIIGCIILYINTNNMAKDKNAKEYYNLNISASVLVLLPFLFCLGTFIYLKYYW
jgi:undecaprenyl pyrophosphate phosphatase UppP